MPKQKIGQSLPATSDIKSDFITIASHQLRTPIAGIRWSLDTLLDGKADKLSTKQYELVTAAYASNNFLVKAVNDLLRAARLEERGVSLTPRPTDLKALVTDVIKRNRTFIAANNCAVTLQLPPRVPKAYVDPLHVKPIIEGIIDNAIKYSRGDGRIKVSLRTAGNRYLVIAISDRGIGIPADQQRSVFSRFFRGRNAMKTQTEGLGLDLYIAKRVIEASGGKITFRSAERNGSTFYLSLPLQKPVAGGSPPAAPPVARAVATGDALKQEQEFVNITVHELKAPLGATKWSLEMLKNQTVGPLNRQQFELIDHVYRGNERLLMLVKDLLDLAKLHSGRFDVSPKPISIEPIIRDVVTSFQPEAAKKEITLTVSLPASLPRVGIDSIRIAQAITNIVSNAMKYTPARGTITVTVERRTGRALAAQNRRIPTAPLAHTNNQHGYLVVSVTDTGIGISKAEQQKLFTRFFRGKGVLKSNTEGTGLGLYITKTIVELHGGDIWFTSRPGGGSAFFVSLPVV